MKRSTRAELAQQTVEIIERGSYSLPNGEVVRIGPLIRKCFDQTTYLTPENLEQIKIEALSKPGHQEMTRISVVNQTTLEGIQSVSDMGRERVVALNFASAKNPGGGFLNGSQAQEESLARSTALYGSLLRADKFYKRHRAEFSLLYSDAMIHSPECPIFRNDEGELLGLPMTTSFITSAAPNAGAIRDNQPEEMEAIPETFRRRSEYVLALAASKGYRTLVLGAWGCGVFRNDPNVVAQAFAEHLRGTWGKRFSHVLFSVYDRETGEPTMKAFERAMSWR
jgi:uncharacterized protein (TIGR02452 family)